MRKSLSKSGKKIIDDVREKIIYSEMTPIAKANALNRILGCLCSCKYEDTVLACAKRQLEEAV